MIERRKARLFQAACLVASLVLALAHHEPFQYYASTANPAT